MAATNDAADGTHASAMERLNMIKVWSHVAQFALTLLTVCVVAPVIAIEIKYYACIHNQFETGPGCWLFLKKNNRAVARHHQTGRWWLQWYHGGCQCYSRTFRGCTNARTSFEKSASSAWSHAQILSSQRSTRCCGPRRLLPWQCMQTTRPTATWIQNWKNPMTATQVPGLSR